MLAGIIPTSKGKVEYHHNGIKIEEDNWFQQLSYAAPYADVYEYMNLEELFRHHTVFKKLIKPFALKEFTEMVYLKGHEHKLIKMYSSGMKQRLKLGLSILSNSRILFLDEPQSNLDDRAKGWYRNLIKEYTNDRIIFIASNDSEDFDLAHERIELPNLSQS